MTRRMYIVIALTLAAGAGAWALAGARPQPPQAISTRAADVWTCRMHPDVREPSPGKCPKCGMDLERAQPAAAPSAIETPRAPVQLDARRRQLLNVRTVRAERTPLRRDVRAVGIVRYDETRLADVNLKLDGYVQRLHVDSTGQALRRGQPLLDLYSPELLATQQEYLLALGTSETLRQSTIADARIQAERLVESARQRLTLWDLPPDVMQRLDRTRRADASITFRSPVSGIVIEKPVVEGMRVAAGQTLYKVADLSSVWVEADVFESDAPFVKVGGPAVVTLDAWPGESLRGRATYIYPFVEEKTRTLKVRFAFANPRLRLKPGMYANVRMDAALGAGITIPADALLDAGQEQLVFVAEGDGYFAPRRVSAGLRVGDRVQIREGLGDGEEVAAGAAFFIDSESQLRAAAGGWSAPSGEPAGAGAAPAADVSLRTDPDPPRSGETTFEVRLTQQGQPVEGADVKVVLYMPAMPSMNMPAMTSDAALTAAGGGVYRGTAKIPMAGRWDVTVTATRAGARIASKQTTVVAR